MRIHSKALLAATVALMGCASQVQPGRTATEVRGWWVSGYEHLELLPCDIVPVGRVWVHFAPGVWEAVVDTLSVRAGPTGTDTLFVRFDGTLSAPDTVRRIGSGYGHLNAYAQQFVVQRIVEVRYRRSTDCTPRRR